MIVLKSNRKVSWNQLETKKGRRGGDLMFLVDATGFEPVTPAV